MGGSQKVIVGASASSKLGGFAMGGDAAIIIPLHALWVKVLDGSVHRT